MVPVYHLAGLHLADGVEQGAGATSVEACQPYLQKCFVGVVPEGVVGVEGVWLVVGWAPPSVRLAYR